MSFQLSLILASTWDCSTDYAKFDQWKYFTALRAHKIPAKSKAEYKFSPRPLYYLDNTYGVQMDMWGGLPLIAVGEPYKQDSVSSASTSSYDWSSNSSFKSPGADFDKAGLFSFRTGSSKEWVKQETEKQDGSIDIKISAVKVQLFKINRGQW